MRMVICLTKKYEIKEVSIRFVNKDGTPATDLRDRKPVRQHYDKNKSCKDLLMSSTIPLNWMHDHLFQTLGYDASSSMCDRWVWDEDKINKASEKSVWKAYALISGYWLNYYEYQYAKEEYEFRRYQRQQGEDLDTIICKPTNIEYL